MTVDEDGNTEKMVLKHDGYIMCYQFYIVLYRLFKAIMCHFCTIN